jgi:hypothetical protein
MKRKMTSAAKLGRAEPDHPFVDPFRPRQGDNKTRQDLDRAVESLDQDCAQIGVVQNLRQL